MTNKKSFSTATEDYLKAIYHLRSESAGVSTTALAAEMSVAPASATNMIKKLAAMKLVRHVPYYGVELTPAGEKIALEIVRHHRLIESFLHEALGLDWDEIHEEANKLEHILSDNLEDHIADFLGHPTEDPHGDPIPTKAGVVSAGAKQTLSDLPSGTHATIRRVRTQDAARLRYLRDLGLVPQAHVHLVEQAPFEGPVRVRVERGGEHSLDRELARRIEVTRTRPTESRRRKTRNKQS